MFLAEIEEAGAGKSAVAGVYRLLRHVLAVAVPQGYLTVNPAAAITLPKVEKEEQHFLEPEQVRALSRTVDPRYEALILFLGYTGVRIGEAAALRVSDVDLAQNRVQIVRASKEIMGHLVVGPTKSRRNRSIDLPAFLVDKLVTHLKKYSVPKDPSALVFTGPKGAAIRHNNSALRLSSRRPDGSAYPPASGRTISDTLPWRSPSRPTCTPSRSRRCSATRASRRTLGTYGHLFKSLHADSATKLDAVYRAADQFEGAGEVLMATPSAQPPVAARPSGRRLRSVPRL